MARRRRRRSSPIEDILDVGTSGFVGAGVVCFLGLLVPVLMRWHFERSAGSETANVVVGAVGAGLLPLVETLGSVVALFGFVCMVVFAVKMWLNRAG